MISRLISGLNFPGVDDRYSAIDRSIVVLTETIIRNRSKVPRFRRFYASLPTTREFLETTRLGVL